MYHSLCERFGMSRVALVVVGNSIIEGRLRNIMSRRGWSVEICQDGDKAVDEYVRLEPEIVFLTLDLPTMDGHIAALEMRKQILRPVLFLFLARLDYQKPKTQHILLERLQHWLHQ